MPNARYRRKQLAKRADWREAVPAAPADVERKPAIPAVPAVAPTVESTPTTR